MNMYHRRRNSSVCKPYLMRSEQMALMNPSKLHLLCLPGTVLIFIVRRLSILETRQEKKKKKRRSKNMAIFHLKTSRALGDTRFIFSVLAAAERRRVMPVCKKGLQ